MVLHIQGLFVAASRVMLWCCVCVNWDGVAELACGSVGLSLPSTPHDSATLPWFRVAIIFLPILDASCSKLGSICTQMSRKRPLLDFLCKNTFKR